MNYLPSPRQLALRLTLAGLLLGAGAVPAAAQAIPTPTTPPTAQLAPFAADAYPRLSTPVTVNRGGRLIDVRPLETTLLADGREVLADRLIVSFQASVAESARQDAHAQAATRGRLAGRPVGQLSPKSFLVDVSGAASLEAAAAAYRVDPRVAAVGPDTLMSATETPNDTRFAEQWGMAKIQAPAAWNRTHGNPSQGGLIAILDSGINEAHPDLAGRVSARADFTGSGSGTTDVNGHGTHVAGIAAATTNNGQGVAGVGYQAFLLNGKVLDDAGAGSLSQLIRGINWASDHGAHVINMSMGATGQGMWDDCDPSWVEDLTDTGVNELRDSINNAWNNGVVLVATAGNKGNSFQQWPGACPNVLSVANTQPDDTRAGDSSFGTWVDVAAPGTDILSTSVDGTYVKKSGTSMAAPHVAGLAYLVRASCALNTPQSVVDRVTSNTDAIAGTGSLWRFGRINALKAACFPAPTALQSGTVTSTSIQIRWQDTTPGETRFEVNFGTAGGPLNTWTNLPANAESYTHTNVPPGGRFTYHVRACDAIGCSPFSNSVTLESNVRSLTVTRTGQGKVTGTGIACGAGAGTDCSEAYTYGTSVTLTATGFTNTKIGQIWAFDHWEGACSGTARTCTVTMTLNRTVRAVFVDLSDEF